jgi:hypothetical protein
MSDLGNVFTKPFPSYKRYNNLNVKFAYHVEENTFLFRSLINMDLKNELK